MNHMIKISVWAALALALLQCCQSRSFIQQHSVAEQDSPNFHYDNPLYLFDYRIYANENSEAQHFGQTEERDHGNVKGQYYVLLPDGRVQTTKYSVSGDSGYVAEVTYD
ncbi:hypothetical protein TCAL_01501 [Tigriopus californicus]|uniref:Uncharacterized protein n=1 Tax=Tigriopus californicus TaxID=6832 RepID=A0A553N8V2_TIGCA|nr:hypothetical protein TCAL_01501 [Tigriopus californicus]|eukprot:TCALIF_01501-PA protein Name:"Protein of unknown function" AED:0.07 eAED:0.07 QI:0/0/0/0.5/1/1/2/0/108